MGPGVATQGSKVKGLGFGDFLAWRASGRKETRSPNP